MSIPAEPNTADRLLNALRAIIRQEVARLTYLGTWEYTVVGTNSDGTINCVATDGAAPLPSLNNVPLRSGPEGGTSTPTTGNLCYVRFVNGDPTRPIVVGNQAIVQQAVLDATDTVNVGASVSNAVVLAGGSSPVARNGDAVTVYFPPGGIVAVGLITQLPPASGSFVGTLTVVDPATGVITTGQPKVLA